MKVQHGHISGFTAVEMTITVVLIGVILALAIPSYRRARERTRIESAKAELAMLSNAILKLAWDTGRWPNGYLKTSANGMNNEIWDLKPYSTGLISTNSAAYPEWRGPYIDTVSLDPWGMPYFFDPDYNVKVGTTIKVLPVVGSFGPNRSGRNLYDADDVYVLLQK